MAFILRPLCVGTGAHGDDGPAWEALSHLIGNAAVELNEADEGSA